jgi:hypothetical protein
MNIEVVAAERWVCVSYELLLCNCLVLKAVLQTRIWCMLCKRNFGRNNIWCCTCCLQAHVDCVKPC